MAAINERRKEFNQNSNQAVQGNQRYHADEVEERFSKYKPGVMRQDCYFVHDRHEYNFMRCIIFFNIIPECFLLRCASEQWGAVVSTGNWWQHPPPSDISHEAAGIPTRLAQRGRDGKLWFSTVWWERYVLNQIWRNYPFALIYFGKATAKHTNIFFSLLQFQKKVKIPTHKTSHMMFPN